MQYINVAWHWGATKNARIERLKLSMWQPDSAKVRRGRRAYQTGQASEQVVERHYQAAGYCCLERRWRGRVGEIDLIMMREDQIVMVEVKSSDRIETALARVTPNKLSRVVAASQDFLVATQRPLNTNMRIDVAVVSTLGQVEVVENVTPY